MKSGILAFDDFIIKSMISTPGFGDGGKFIMLSKTESAFGGGRDDNFDLTGTCSRLPGSDHLVGNVHYHGQHTGVSQIQNRQN